MLTVNEILSKNFGLENDWEGFIKNKVPSLAKRFQNNAYIDDIQCELLSVVVLDNKLHTLMHNAVENFETLEDKLNNAQRLLSYALRRRISSIRDNIEKRNKMCYRESDIMSDCEDSSALDRQEGGFYYHFNQTDYQELIDLLVGELICKSEKATHKLTKQLYKLASEIAPYRVRGMKFQELMAKFDIKHKSTMQKIIEMIQNATLEVCK